MHILLLILKIIGLSILGLLGLALFLLLIVLFWPVRYQAKAAYHGQPDIRIDVGWLFRLIHFKILYRNGELVKKFTILGLSFKRGNKGKKREKPEKVKKAGKEKRTEEQAGNSNEAAGDSKEMAGKLEGQTTHPKEQAGNSVEAGEIPSEQLLPDENNMLEPMSVERDSSEQTASKPTFFEKIGRKIANLVAKVIRFFRKIKSFGKNLTAKIKRIFKKIKKLGNKVKNYYEFAISEETKGSLGFLWGIVKKILSHCSPRNVKGQVTFGLDDPCTTGELLGAYSIFYGKFANRIKVIPKFEEKCFDADLRLHGHIQLGVIGLHALKILFSKEFKSLKHNFEQLKEDS